MFPLQGLLFPFGLGGRKVAWRTQGVLTVWSILVMPHVEAGIRIWVLILPLLMIQSRYSICTLCRPSILHPLPCRG